MERESEMTRTTDRDHKTAPAGPTVVTIVTAVETITPHGRKAVSLAFRDELGTLLDRTYVIGTPSDPHADLFETWFGGFGRSDVWDLVELTTSIGLDRAVRDWTRLIGVTLTVNIVDGQVDTVVREEEAEG